MRFVWLLWFAMGLAGRAIGEEPFVWRTEPFDSDWHAEKVPRSYTVDIDRVSAEPFRKIFMKIGVADFAYIRSKPEKPHLFSTTNGAFVLHTEELPGSGPRAHVTIFETKQPDGEVTTYSRKSKRFIKIALSADESRTFNAVFNLKPERKALSDYSEKIVLQKYLSDSANFVEVICTFEENDLQRPACKVSLRIDTAQERKSPFPPKIWPGELLTNEDHYSYLDAENNLEWAMPFEEKVKAVAALRDIDSAREACGAIGYSLPSVKHFLEGEVTLNKPLNQVRTYYPKLERTLKPKMSLGRFFTEGHPDITLEEGQILLVDFLDKSRLRVVWNQDPALLAEVVCVRSISPRRKRPR